MKIITQNTVSGFIHKPKVKSILINCHEQPSADFPQPVSRNHKQLEVSALGLEWD